MKPFRSIKHFLLFVQALSILVVAVGCATRHTGAPSPEPIPAPAFFETGYSVQLGAFSVLGNAVRLTEYLKGQGADAYYFRHDSGLYKVRLGDYPTRAAALAAARELVAGGIVETYFIVGPKDYALAKARVHGKVFLREEIVRTAKGFMGLPYQWGGHTPEKGFDCSGLIMASYQMNGLNIPRSSPEQFQKGRPVSRKELGKADLVFFSTKRGRKVSHVGLYVGNNTFIHAPGTGKSIRVDSLSNPYYRRHYAGSRSYF